MQGLQALGVPAESYGGLLTSVMMNKLPPVIRLSISHKLFKENWKIKKMLKIINCEVVAREQLSILYNSNTSVKGPQCRVCPLLPPLWPTVVQDIPYFALSFHKNIFRQHEKYNNFWLEYYFSTKIFVQIFIHTYQDFTCPHSWVDTLQSVHRPQSKPL